MFVVLTLGAATLGGINPPKPNIIFMLADDWGYGDVGAYKTLLANGVDKVGPKWKLDINIDVTRLSSLLPRHLHDERS